VIKDRPWVVVHDTTIPSGSSPTLITTSEFRGSGRRSAQALQLALQSESRKIRRRIERPTRSQ
jgi:hypothetical protein